jgi:hypothetical protein
MRRVCPWGLSLRQELPPWTRALLAARITAYGSLPWVATLCGHVVLGARAVAVHRAPSGDTVFTLTEPGRWWDAFANRVLTTDRGGRPWLVWTPR